jgi:hypothetical protein
VKRDATIESAERALRRAMPGARLEPLALLTDPKRRSRVLRCALSGVRGARTVILKTFVGRGGTNVPATTRFENERASLELLGSLGDPPLAPRLFAAHRSALTLVMEDLGTPPTLVQPLLEGSARAAERALLSWARCLGDQHARTAKRARHRMGERIHATIDPAVIGLAFDVRAERELADLRRALDSPGAFRAFTHNDPCPDNCFREGDRYRFIDFEFGGYRHALLDGVYWHTQFPTCWCANRVPPSLVAKLEAAYRDELGRGCPAAKDDRAFDLAVVRGAAARTLGLLERPMATWWIERDAKWGIATVRQRLPTRFRSFAALARSRKAYPALADFADGAADRIEERFAPEMLPLYPAFRRPRSATA